MWPFTAILLGVYRLDWYVINTRIAKTEMTKFRADEKTLFRVSNGGKLGIENQDLILLVIFHL